MFRDIEYLSWIEGRPDAVAHDLGSSDLRPATQSPGPIPDRLADVADPPPAESLESMLADCYDVPEENVLVTAGATVANALAFAVAATEPAFGPAEAGASGEGARPRVLIEQPGYEPFVATPAGFDAGVDRFPREGGDLDPGLIERALGDGTTLVGVTNRHNPTGALVDRPRLGEVAAVAGDANARLLVDEVYAPCTRTAMKGPFGGPTAAGLEHTIVTSSLTKFLGFGGLRIGWLVADAEFVDAAERVGQHLQAVAEPSRQLARRALAARDALAADRRERLRRNHDHLDAFVSSHDSISGTVHPGSPIALLEHDRLDGDALAERALEHDVLVAPGRFFDRPDAIRMSIGRPTAHVDAALDAFGDVLDAIDEPAVDTVDNASGGD